VPKSLEHKDGKLLGMTFEIVRAVYDAKGRRSLVPTGEARCAFLECDAVLVAVGQENAFPWIEPTAASSSTSGASSAGQAPSSPPCRKVFFGGDAAFGPKNIITAVAHGHEAAVSIDRFLHGESVADRRRPPT
jgi:formate dehydrogenase beta subunit